jgi:hypothetical protein
VPNHIIQGRHPVEIKRHGTIELTSKFSIRGWLVDCDEGFPLLDLKSLDDLLPCDHFPCQVPICAVHIVEHSGVSAVVQFGVELSVSAFDAD